MKKILRLELKRAFQNRGMVLALGIGCLIVIIQVIHEVAPLYMANMSGGYKKEMILSPNNLSEGWISGNYSSLFGFIFFLILPILSVMPFGTSYFEDNNGGYLKNIYIRTTRKQYLSAKYIATFLSGGMAVIIPLILNLIIVSGLLPNILPNALYRISGIGPDRILCELYFTRPMAYIGVFLLLDFLMGGIWATLALAASYLSDYKIIVSICPFFLQLIIHILCTIGGFPEHSSVFFLRAGYGIKYIGVVVIYMVIGGCVAWITFRKKGVSVDVF